MNLESDEISLEFKRRRDNPLHQCHKNHVAPILSIVFSTIFNAFKGDFLKFKVRLPSTFHSKQAFFVTKFHGVDMAGLKPLLNIMEVQ